MDEMQKAIQKIDSEAETLAKKKPVMKIVGQLLTDFVTAHPETAKNFANEKKSLEGAYKAVENEARKKEKGGAYCMSDEEFMDLVLDYYGIKDIDRAPAAIESKQAKKPVAAGSKVDVGGLLEGL